MDPGEPWSADWLLVAGGWGLGVGDPRLGGGNGLRSCSLRHVECGSIAPLSVAVVVHVEAAIEAESAVERKCADECARPISERMQHRCEGVDLLRQPEAGILVDAVVRRIEARQDVRVRWQRHDGMGMRGRKSHAPLRQTIDRWRGRARVAVRADRVSAQRIDRDEQHVETRLPVNRRRPTARDRADREREGYQAEPTRRHPFSGGGDQRRFCASSIRPSRFG